MHTPSRVMRSAALIAVFVGAQFWGALPLGAHVAAAATVFTVTTASDRAPVGACGTDCTLREAIIAANGTPGAEIHFNLPATVSCGSPVVELFRNNNVDAVSDGGTPPGFNTSGVAFCLTHIWHYHWHNATGATPGQVALKDAAGTTVGTWPAIGSAGQGGAPNVNWDASIPTAAPVVLNGAYTCEDSDQPTWSQNAASLGKGFCVVWGAPAILSYPSIALSSPLPATISPVTIDATTQPGYSGTPLVVLDGIGAGAEASGLVVRGGDSAIRGLSIVRFGHYGVELQSNTNVIGPNYIGLGAGGEALGNGRSTTSGGAIYGGIRVASGTNNTVGNANAQNVVAANSGQGIEVSGAAQGTSVLNNIVGTTSRVASGLGNTVNGIYVGANGTTVRGNTSWYNGTGLAFSADSLAVTFNSFEANLNLGVLGSGSNNTFSSNVVIANANGGFMLGYPGATTRNNQFADNTVRNNGGDGFVFRGPAGQPTEITDANTIVRGSITNNAAKGINLAFGANGAVQPPVITNIVNDTTFVVSGTAAPNARIQVYADPTSQGATFLGSTTSSDGDGSWSIGAFSYEGIGGIANSVKAGSLVVRATQSTAQGTSEFSEVISGIVGVATCGGERLLYGATVELFSGSVLVATTLATADTATYAFPHLKPNSTYRVRITKFVPGIDVPGVTYTCEATTITDRGGHSSVLNGVSILNRHNHTWVSAYQVAAGATYTDYVFQQGQSTWFKIPITRGQRVTATMTNVPADYSLALYKDIRKIFEREKAALAGANPLAAVNAHDASVAPDALSPDALSPDALSPDALSPDALSPDALSPDALSPDALSPDELSPDELSPDALSPDALSPDALSPDALSPDALSQAYSGAQTSALIGVSAHVGLSPEQISRNTWDNTGDFYIRVRGHNGAFDASAPFTIRVSTTDVSCTGAAALSEYPQALTVAGTNALTLILTNSARLSGDAAGFITKLNTFKTRSDVRAEVVDLGAMSTMTPPYAQWDAHPACPAAANILAHSIKDLINAYATANPTLRYIVLAGNDAVVPFYRQPDQAGLGSEKDYFPSVKDTTASQASLRLGHVLTQDFYGSLQVISRIDHELYLPDLAVGRLVETVAQMSAVIDAFVATNGTVAPTTALVTGYDFLSDTAGFIASQLQANSLTVDRSLIQPIGDKASSPTAWTGAQLKAKLLGPTSYGILSLNSHFSANTLLAADFATRVRTSDIAGLAASDLRFQNALVLSTGCHSGYNIVDGAQTALTDPMDWAQAFAARGATLVGGTGYQYGDTDFMKYSEQILANTALELRYGAGRIPIGVALANAKRTYLSTVPSLTGIDEKAVAEATLYGLPMLGYNLPAGSRLARPAETTVPNPIAGTSAQLSTATVAPTYRLNRNTRSLLNLGGTGAQTAVWYDINGNVAVSPGAPVLPQFSFDVAKNGTAARGAVLLSATYSDENATAFTDVAAIEARGAHPRAKSDVFTPVRPFALNHLAGTHLVSTPFQFHSTPNQATGVARTFTAETFRLYYSSLTDTRALAAAPTVYNVSLAPDGAGSVNVSVRVGGLTSVGIEDVFATYTGESGSLYHSWTSTPLVPAATAVTRGDAFARTYTGTIPLGTTNASDLRVVIQAAGGNGLVTWAGNDGAYYRVPTETATAADPKVATALTLTVPTNGAYRASVPVSALLTAAGLPLAGKPVAFRSGGLRIDALTNASGIASARLFLRSAPGPANVSVGFAEEQQYLGSGDQSQITIDKAAALFTLSGSTPIPTGGSALIATLRSALEPLSNQMVTLTAAGRQAQTFTDGNGRVRLDTMDGFPSGAYPVFIAYDGNDRYGPATGTSSVVVFDPSGFAAGIGSVVAGTDAIGFIQGTRVGFAFAAVYPRGATTPIGLFEVLSLESRILFSATSFDWLTVNGTRAEMRGHGKVNGQAGWSFRAVAVDGTPDQIEIRLWHVGLTTELAPSYRVTGTLARGIIVGLLQPGQRDLSPEELRGLAEGE